MYHLDYVSSRRYSELVGCFKIYPKSHQIDLYGIHFLLLVIDLRRMENRLRKEEKQKVLPYLKIRCSCRDSLTCIFRLSMKLTMHSLSIEGWISRSNQHKSSETSPPTKNMLTQLGIRVTLTVRNLQRRISQDQDDATHSFPSHFHLLQ